MDIVVWSLRDWESQDFDRDEVEALLKAKGLKVKGWINNTPDLEKGTLIDAQRVIEGAESVSEDAKGPKPKRRRRK